MKTLKKAFFLITLLVSYTLQAQNLTQTLRGKIIDQVTQTPLPGATVIILNTDPLMGATTDVDGEFKILKLPIGTYAIRVTFVGYKDFVLPNVVVNSGKEVVLNIPIEEDIVQMEEIVITAAEKDRTINDMVLVSGRTFSVEETRKFAAAINDPARMAASFSGVVSTDDGNNNISIRGNNPNGLLWRMEGIDIPNPNHFVSPGASGGGISILSSQLLTNSDFMTGAFAAEYGNALSGVFDLSLRKGNNEKRELTFQAGFLGVDFAAEGPVAKNYKGSYLVNYRYSTLSILSKLGVPLGDYITNFQDLSVNIHLPTGKKSAITIFGFGGLSDQKNEAKKDSLVWEYDYERYSSNYFSNTGALGVKHAYMMNKNNFLQTTVLASGNELGDITYKLDDDYTNQRWYDGNFSNSKITLSSVLNTKLSARYSMRSGIYLNQLNYSLRQQSFHTDVNQFLTDINSKGNTQSIQAFSQVNIKASEQLTINGGVHYLQLLLNNSFSVEPRVSASYALDEVQRINFGYGLHSQVQPLGTYFGEHEENGEIIKANKNLDLSKSHHFVVGYDRSLNPFLRMKVETYYQHLFNIPIKAGANETYSILNQEWSYETDPLVNDGYGKNYGVEFTLEQFTHNNLYFLLSTSVYNSLYKTNENKWRNTRFNGNANITFTGGKEFMLKKDRVLGINLRSIYSGGLRTTPINLDESIARGETVHYDERAFEDQNPAYFRTDLRISLKRNKPKSTHTLALDIQNVTNRKNIYGKYFEPLSGEINTAYQTPLIPVLSYKIEF
ncbi:MAG: carboxypeptidase-like regulatory domain-containing protein [Cyclobacteriaceae bacterium]|nr:carboxypeptidase-like regulatory domain-containing protein [Cyclobacteriaceae bacterium]